MYQGLSINNDLENKVPDYIHLESETVDLLTTKLKLFAEDLFDSAETLYSSGLNADWEGASKADFLYDLYCCTSSLKNLADTMDLLRFQLAQESEQWITIAQTFQS